VLVGVSRKSFLGKITGSEDPKSRLFGTMAANVLAYERGASLFRVHDVRANKEALAVAAAIRRT
jgi:dihydropteroate synthase